MKCPACDALLQPFKVNQLTVDICGDGCGGIWFDNFELKQVDEVAESAGEALLVLRPIPGVAIDQRQRRRCPRCPEIVMMRHFHDGRRNVEVDTCPGCGGVWLDAGELALIREEAGSSKEERQQAARQYFQQVLQRDFIQQRSARRESAP